MKFAPEKKIHPTCSDTKVNFPYWTGLVGCFIQYSKILANFEHLQV